MSYIHIFRYDLLTVGWRHGCGYIAGTLLAHRFCAPFVIHGPYAGALDAESPKIQKRKCRKTNGHEICSVLKVLHHILHARSCNHFLWFPHTPKLPRPQKRPIHFKFILAFFQFLFCWDYFLEPIWTMVTRPVQGPYHNIAQPTHGVSHTSATIGSNTPSPANSYLQTAPLRSIIAMAPHDTRTPRHSRGAHTPRR